MLSNPDAVRAFAASLAALVIIIGSLVMLFVLLDRGIVSGEAGLALLSSLIGGAVTWLFVQNAQSSASRSAERSTEAGFRAAMAQPPQMPVSVDASKALGTTPDK